MAVILKPKRSTTASAVPTTGQLADGELAVNSTDKKIYIRVGAAIVELFKTLTGSDVGLGNVNNTSDASKPVSTAQQTALNLKADIAGPTFTGVPAAPTAALNTNTTQLATTAFVQASLAPVAFGIACSDEVSNLTTGTAKATFRMPMAISSGLYVRASLSTAQASGSLLTVNIKANGTSIFSTKITFDNTEKTSTTAATLPVLNVSSLADDAEITVDIDVVGTAGARGLKVWLGGRAP